MATQTVEFPASTGRTLTAIVYPVGSDTASATASSTVESTNRKGVYVATFTGLAGDYLLIAEDGNSVPACIDPLTGVTNTAATFQTNSISNAVAKVTTATNLTNAPTAGDLTATMKASVTTAATAATPAAASVTGNVGGNVGGSVGSVTNPVTAGTVTDKTGYALTSGERTSIAAVVLTTAMTESYAASGAAPTLAQVQFILQQMLAGNFSISGTTITVFKLDGVTTAATFTLNSSTAPTSLARAT